MTDPLASATDLATYLRRDVDPAAATLLVNGVSALVRSYCGWVIAPAETGVTVTVDGSGARVQPLPTRHLTDVSALIEDDTDVPLADVDYSEAGYLTRRRKFTGRPRGLTVTISHGFTEAPAEVAMVVLAVAARGADNPSAASAYTVGNVSVSYSRDASGPTLQPFEQAVLDRYRLPARC